MKTLQLKTGLTVLILFLCGLSNISFAQQFTVIEEPSYNLVFKSTEEGYTINCKSGCLWKSVSWTYKADNNQIIDNSGITNATSLADDPKFAFSIKKVADGYELTGLKGMGWEKLKLNCETHNCKAKINRSGIRL